MATKLAPVKIQDGVSVREGFKRREEEKVRRREHGKKSERAVYGTRQDT
jgi:hypothetical protein